MKKNTHISLWLIIGMLLTFSQTVSAVTHIVQVTNFSFTPQNIPSVQLGDVIRWQWVGGAHTTTSDVIPAGAASWNAAITSGSTFFEYTPTVAGTYDYICIPHAAFGMTGSFTVVIPVSTTKTSTQSGNWSSSSTWGGNPPPTASDDVIIHGDDNVTVDIPNGSCTSLQLGGSLPGSGTGTITFASGSQLTISGLVSIGPENSNNTAGSLSMASGGILRCEGFDLTRLGTWTAGSGSIELSSTNTIPSDNNIIFNNLTMTGGTTSLVHNLTVLGNLTINAGASMNGGINTLNVGGNWVNNGTFTGNAGTVTFDKNGNQTITGNGLNNFNLLRVDQGANFNNTLEVLSTNFSAPAGFLTIVNGTFKISGTFSFTNTFFVGPIYNIQPTSGLWLNNPNVTITAQAGGASVRGLLRITAGTCNIGTSLDHSLTYVSGSTINIEGGALNIAGQLTRNNATATTAYAQSGGTVSLVTQGSTDPTYAGFDLGAVGSTFAMSGGSIIIRNACSAPSDYLNASSLATVTGGTLQLGDANTANAQIFRIQSPRPVGNLLISNASSQAVKPTVQLVNSSLTIVGNVTIQSGTTLNSNGFNLTIGGNWSDNGTFTAAGNTVSFNGTGAQSITNPAGETFNHLSISGSGAKTATGAITVNGNFTNGPGISFTGATALNLIGTTHLNGGTLSVGSLSVGAGGALTNNGTTTATTDLSGAGNLIQGTSATLNLGGTAGISSFDATAAGNTVNYNGASQTVKSAIYHHLTLSGSGSANLTGTSSINGNLTLSGTVSTAAATALSIAGNFTAAAGTTFDAGTFPHTLSGNWSNSGTFNAGTSTFTLNGAAAQTIGGASVNNLVITNTAGVSLVSDETVNGTLTLTNGTFSIGANTLSLNAALSIGSGSLSSGSSSNLIIGGSGASITIPGLTLNNLSLNRANGLTLNGDATIHGTLNVVNGTLSTGINTIFLESAATLSEAAGQVVLGNIMTTRVINTTSGTESFGNIGVDLTPNGIAPGSTLIIRKTGTLSSGNGHTSIKRYFDITPTTNTGLNAGVVFHYDAAELNGQNAIALELYRSHDNGISWNNMGGAVNTIARTITVSGINDFSRWTAADTSNRLGNTVVPATTSISPSSKFLGSSNFTITVNGSNFVNGKSTVQFNGANRTTTFVNASQLTAVITAADLLVAGSFPISVFNANGGGSSNAQTFTVVPLPAYKVRVETAADGTGSVVAAQSISSGSTLTVYAITRDSLNNFIANVAATAWTLENLTGGVVAGDLVAAANGKSATFSGHITGSGSIKATSGILTPTSSGLLTVTAGTATKVRVETAANGSGTLVLAQTLASGAAVTVYSITRDASNNFVANVAASAWALENITGGVVAGDLLAAADNKSATFTGHVIGTATIKASSAALSTTSSGVLTVIAGPAAKVRVETAANGSGTLVLAQALTSGSTVTGYSITRDAANNFVANTAATAWSLETISGGVVAGDLIAAADNKSAVFTAHVIGAAAIKASAAALTATASGLITVTAGTANKVLVETAANGSGTIVPAQSLASGAAVSVYSITRDASNNFVANVAASAWALENITGGVVAGGLLAAADNKSATFTGHVIGTATIKASSAALSTTSSGVLTVIAGPATKVNVETAANGSGTMLAAQTLPSGSSLTVYSITRDAANNFVANTAATAWSLENISGGVVAGDLLAAADNKSATFTGNASGTTNIKATSGILTANTSGLITVVAGSATIQGSITYKNGLNTPINNSIVILKQNGIVVAQTTTDASGQYSFTNLGNGIYNIVCSISKPWGGVNSNDALLIMKHFAAVSPLSGLNLKVADVNNSLSVNALDALLVTKRFVDSISSFAVGDWITETNSTIVGAPATFVVNLNVLCTGDVNGSYIPAP